MQASSSVALDRLQADATPHEKARQLVRGLQIDSSGLTDLKVTVEVKGSPARDLGPELSQILEQVIILLSEGKKVVVGSETKELTTTVAARQLGMSRPTLMKLIKEQKIPAHKVGSHFRINAEDVETFRQKQLAERFAAFTQLRDSEAEIGMNEQPQV